MSLANRTIDLASKQVLVAADGTAAAPSITNDGDTNTGMFFPAADTIAFSEGGTEALRLTSTGAISVGSSGTNYGSSNQVLTSQGNTSPIWVNAYTGFKNRIINGDMRIDQRNAGAAVTVNSTANTYSIDRWYGLGQTADGVFALQQNAGSVTPPVGFTDYLGATVTTADTSIGANQVYRITQAIEGLNCTDLAWGTANAKTITLSFWVRSSLTGTFGGNVANAGFTRAYPYSYTISSANTWEYKTITVAGDTTGTWLTTNGVGVHLSFVMGMGSNWTGTANAWNAGLHFAPTGNTNIIATNGATFYITGVQLEAGSTATDFERRPFGTELALCQRYFQSYGGVSAADNICMGASLTSTQCVGFVQLPVSMRTSPSVGFTSVNAVLLDDNGAGVISNSIVTNVAGTTSVYLSIPSTTTAGLTANRPARMYVNGINARVTWSAEL